MRSFAFLLLAGLVVAQDARVDGVGDVTVSEAFTHENLTIFIFAKKAKPEKEPDYITLEEGLKSGVVTITEQPNERVNRLQIDNNSDKPLFIQDGEIVKGGKQDRTMQTSLVVPPKTVKVAIASFCVEHNRWTGEKGFSDGGGMASGKALRQAIQEKNQNEVWEKVAEDKGKLAHVMKAESKTSSMAEELDKVKDKTGPFEKALGDALAKFECPVGMAFSINGVLNTIDLYHSSLLFKKLYPRLLKAAAIEAIANPPKDAKVEPVKPKEVADFLTSAFDGKKTETALENKNVYVQFANDKAFAAQLRWDGTIIHVKAIKRDSK